MTTVSEPSPAARARSSSANAAWTSSATSADARWRSAAATACSIPARRRAATARCARPPPRAHAPQAAVLRARRARGRARAGAPRAARTCSASAARSTRTRSSRTRRGCCELVAQPAQQRLGRFAPHADALAALRSRYSSCIACSRAPAASASSSSARPRSASTASSRSSAARFASAAAARRLRRFAEPVVERREIELGDARAQLRELAAQLLGALGGRRLQRERTQPLLHLRLEVACALDLDRDARELQLGAMPTRLEAAEAGRLLDQRAPLLRLRPRIASTLPCPMIECMPWPSPRSASSSTRSMPPHGGAC